MKLQAVDRQRFVFDRRHRASVRTGQGNKIVGNRLDLVSMAHPDFVFCGKIGQERIRFRGLANRPAELAVVFAFDFAAQVFAKQLHPVTDT